MLRQISCIAVLIFLLVPVIAAADRDRGDREGRDGSTERVPVTLQDAAQTSPIDVSAVTNEGNQSSNSTSVTTTVGNDLLLSFPKWETATWSSYGAGETEDMAPTSSDMEDNGVRYLFAMICCSHGQSTTS